MEIVGVPREIKPGEKRVGLTPKGVAALAKRGVGLFVEEGAGEWCGFPDEDYREAGATLVSTAQEIWQKASLIKKVKEPIAEEFSFLRRGQILFTFLHLASPQARELVQQLVQSGVTALSCETVEVLGYTPILKPMSLIAGTIAGFLSGLYRHFVRVEDGKIIQDSAMGELITEFVERFPTLPRRLDPGKVVVLGGGQAGLKAAEAASLMGGKVTISEVNPHRRHYLHRYFEGSVEIISDFDALPRVLAEADAIVTCVYLKGRRAPVLIDENLLREVSAPKRKIILDISVDQGGNVFGSLPTTYENPLYLDSFGNLRFGVTNMPSLCPTYATIALEGATLDYTLALSEGLREALKRYPELRSGLAVYGGKVVQEDVARVHQIPWTPVTEVL